MALVKCAALPWDHRRVEAGKSVNLGSIYMVGVKSVAEMTS